MRKELAQLYGGKIYAEAEDADKIDILQNWHEEAFEAWKVHHNARFVLDRRGVERFQNMQSFSGRMIEAARCLMGHM